jgi:hypothetical protein
MVRVHIPNPVFLLAGRALIPKKRRWGWVYTSDRF